MTTANHLFTGGGGDLDGFRAAGFRARSAFNHAPPAVATVRLNFPGVRAECENVHTLDMRRLPYARVLVGSPICKEAAPAGGNSAPQVATLDDAVEEADDVVEQDDLKARPAIWSQTRATAWDLIRAEECGQYDVIVGENVPGFATRWDLFDDWLRIWDKLGKFPTLVSFDAAHLDGEDFTAAPQHRHRIAFVLARKGLPRPDLRPRPRAVCEHCGDVRAMQQWARPRMRKTATYGEGYRYICPNRRCGHREVVPLTRPIGDVLDLSAPTRRFGDGKAGKKFRPYAATTRAKVELGLRRFEGKPFLVILRNHSTVQSLDEAAPAFTAEGNHHMYVEPAGATLDDCRVRMFTNREKARGQGFPDSHQFAGTSTEVNRQIGNAFPPPSARWLAERVREVLA
ncbi:DNA cytosine methyltransferase [Streptomyces sp. NPDC006332]|uniref:DNA cytosine methyltransferase n=1 Tax=Streptomyces sp. NPDC006332 TaxID=3155456 RepID=UPI0033B9A977